MKRALSKGEIIDWKSKPKKTTTPCLSASAESTTDSFPMKIWSVKLFPAENV